MDKRPFATLEQLREIEKTYPTPFYLYDEKGIRENAAKLKQAFSWNKGYKEYLSLIHISSASTLFLIFSA